MADSLLADVETPVSNAPPEPKPGEAGTPKPEDAQGDKGGEQSVNPPEDLKYELKMPEGVEFDSKHVEDFTKFSKDELKLPPDQAQKLLEWYGKTVQTNAKSMETVWKETNDGWIKSAREDKEIGGDKFDANLAIAKQALKKFGSPELTEALNYTGAGNHPELIKFFYKVAKATGEDTMTSSDGAAPGGKQESLAEILFPTKAN